MDSNNLKPIFSAIQKFTMLDDNDNLSLILFTGGCNFRCSYCHNPEFVIPKEIKYKPVIEIVNFLEKRKEVLDSVTICGGEPTLHTSNLVNWIRYIKSLGYRVKLDSNGTRPEVISKLIKEKLVDFFAIDYKAPLRNYPEIINKEVNTSKILESLNLIINSNIDYEIRSTIHPSLHSQEDVKEMVAELAKLNVKNYYLQAFLEPKRTVGNIKNRNFSRKVLDNFNSLLSNKFIKFGIRNI